MTLSELHDEIGHAEYVFRSEMDHLPEVLLLGRKEFELLVSSVYTGGFYFYLSLIHISEPTRRTERSRMPSSA